MTYLFYIAILSFFLFLLSCPFRSSLERKIRREESLLQNYGFQRIQGGYYILKNGKTGIYTRGEALRMMATGIEPRDGENHEHTD